MIWTLSGTIKLRAEAHGKVKKIEEDSLDSIPSPSPSVKIKIMGGKVDSGCKGKKLAQCLT